MPPREAPAPAPPLGRAAQEVGKAGLDSARQAWEVIGAFRRLVAADLTLSRAAFGASLAWTAGAIILGASGWIFLMAVAVLALHEAAGLSWLWAMVIPAVVSVGAAGGCAWAAMRAFQHTSLGATRRQLARFGMAGDPAHDDDPEVGAEPKPSERPPEPEEKAPPPQPVEPPA